MNKQKPVADNESRIMNQDLGMSPLEVELEAEKILADAKVDAGSDSRATRPEDCKPKFFENTARAYNEFQRVFGIPNKIFYPGCGADITPVKAFPNSQVTLLDIDDSAAAIVRSAGIPILNMPVEKYKGKHDLIILLNSTFSPGLATPFLERGGKIIANNYFAIPDYLKDMGYPILGLFEDKGDRSIFVPEHGRKLVVDSLYVFGDKEVK